MHPCGGRDPGRQPGGRHADEPGRRGHHHVHPAPPRVDHAALQVRDAQPGADATEANSCCCPKRFSKTLSVFE